MYLIFRLVKIPSHFNPGCIITRTHVNSYNDVNRTSIIHTVLWRVATILRNFLKSVDYKWSRYLISKSFIGWVIDIIFLKISFSHSHLPSWTSNCPAASHESFLWNPQVFNLFAKLVFVVHFLRFIL